MLHVLRSVKYMLFVEAKSIVKYTNVTNTNPLGNVLILICTVLCFTHIYSFGVPILPCTCHKHATHSLFISVAQQMFEHTGLL